MGSKIRVSVQIIGENHKQLYNYSELLQSGGETQVIKTRQSADNIVETMARDVRKMCLITDES